MQEIRGLIRLVAIGSFLLVIKAGHDDCQFPASACQEFKEKCTRGDDGIFVFQSSPKSHCDGILGSFCDISEGAHCKQGRVTPTDSGPSQQCFDLNEWRHRALEQTNQYRSIHNANPLLEDPTLDEIGQDYAEELLMSGNRKSRDPYPGESVFRDGPWTHSYISQSYRPERAIDWFYSEVRFWNFESSQPYGHKTTSYFTQLVWKASRKVGYGIASDRDCRQIVVVAVYDPPGNLRGRFRKNVAPPVSDSRNAPDGCYQTWVCR